MTDTQEYRAKLLRIARAIPALDPKNPKHFTGNGKPTAQALADVLNEEVTAAERDEVWAAHLAALDEIAEGNAADVEEAPATDEGGLEMKWNGQWAVTDTNAVAKNRTHSPVEGVAYPLSAKRATPMPREHAVKFLSDPSFRVFNEYGDHVPDLPSAESLRAGQDRRITLAANEVVAKMHELTTEAILTRCQRFPGGERMNKKTSRATMEEFLVDAMKRRTAGVPDKTVSEDGDLIEDGGRGYKFEYAGRDV